MDKCVSRPEVDFYCPDEEGRVFDWRHSILTDAAGNEVRFSEDPVKYNQLEFRQHRHGLINELNSLNRRRNQILRELSRLE